MKNKKGILTKNVLSLLVAVMGVILLVFVSVAIYNSFESTEEKNARAFIDSLFGKIENLEDGETGVFPMRSVKDWRVLGYGGDLLRKEVPEKCFFNSCICICPAVGHRKYSWKEDLQKESCQSNGFCKDLGNKEIKLSTDLQLKYGGNICKWKGTEQSVIVLKEEGVLEIDLKLLTQSDTVAKLLEIEIIKEENFINISLINWRNIEDFSLFEQASQRSKLLEQLNAKTIELNDSTKECYFIKN